MRKPTEFEMRVYKALSEVPAGKVTTYALLAASIDCGSAQAVGQALKRNPYAPKVPCHRVITSNLTIGGFAGRTSGCDLVRKKKLLAREGVFFRNGALVGDPDKLVYRFGRPVARRNRKIT